MTTGSYTCTYHHVWWVVLHLKHVTKILFSPKKHFKIGSCSKLHIHLKIELFHETRLSEIIPTTTHMLCDIVSCHWPKQLHHQVPLVVKHGPM